LTERPETKIKEPVQLAEQLDRAYPGHTDAVIEVLTDVQVWGYILCSDGVARGFRAHYGHTGVWTVSPVYSL
jgi:hypothetical protein